MINHGGEVDSFPQLDQKKVSGSVDFFPVGIVCNLENASVVFFLQDMFMSI